MKKILTTILIILLLAGCGQQKNRDELVVITTFYPLYDLASKIVGDKGEVINLLPNNIDAHDYEPTPKDMVKVKEANVFIYHGADFEHWVDNILSSLNENTVVVEVSDSVDLIKNNDGFIEIYDPHTWISPYNTLIELTAIYEAIINTDPINESYYTKNYEHLSSRLNEIIKDYEALNINSNDLSQTIVVDHNAYAYLSKDFDLNVFAINQNISTDEPTIKDLQSTIDYIKTNNIPYIFADPTGNQDIISVIEKQTSVSVLPLYTMETIGTQDSNDLDYVDMLEVNLNSLKQLEK